MTRPPTLLELLLPSGRAADAMVLGSGAPEWLQPTTGAGPADLVIVAPAREEADRSAWVDDAVGRAAAATAPDGMLYLMLPSGARRRAMRRLRTLGLTPGMPYVHHPSFDRTEHLVPAERVSLRHWVESGESMSPRLRRAAAAAMALPGADHLAAAVLPAVGVAAFRADSSTPFAWLARASGREVARGRVRAKWRGGRGGAVVTGLDRTGTPVAVAKVALGGDGAEARAAREAERLTRLGPAARQAGALVPSATLAQLPGGWPVLLLTPMPGRPAASLIGGGSQPPEAVIAGLTEWLARWSEATLTPGRLTPEWIEGRLVAPARVLGPDLPDAYLAGLRARAETALGEILPSLATHGDLTMTNVLLAGSSLGIVDWEAADLAGVPLGDLLYAAVDATAARDGYHDRLRAFEHCFPAGGAAPGLLGQGLGRLRRQAGLSETATALCVHACWLQHAAHEQGKRGPGEPRPFLSIVRSLAERAARGEPQL